MEKDTQHALVYDIHFLTKDKSEYCGAIIDSISYAPIFVLEDNDRKDKSALNNTIRKVFDGKLIVKYALKVTAHDSP